MFKWLFGRGRPVEAAPEPQEQYEGYTRAQRSQLQSLDRMVGASVTHVTLLSPQDERCTPLERELEGKRMTLAEARRLVLEQPEDIPRSVFIGEVDL